MEEIKQGARVRTRLTNRYGTVAAVYAVPLFDRDPSNRVVHVLFDGQERTEHYPIHALIQVSELEDFTQQIEA